MSYLHIQNLYRSILILEFKTIYAMEKVHGSSANLRYDGSKLHYFAGGESHEKFTKIFDDEKLTAAFAALGHGIATIIVYGEVYGGKCQGMSATYGKDTQFIAFDVKIEDCWLDVEKADKVVQSLGLEFVPYEKGPAELSWIDPQRDADSIVAVRRGMGSGKKREGVVLRPPFEVTLNNGERLIAKHKRDEFRERQTPQQVVDPAKLAVLTEAQEVADEWVVENRLIHILQKISMPHHMGQTQEVIAAMVEDVMREAAVEIVDTKEVRKAIGTKAVLLFKALIKREFENSQVTR